MAEVIKPAPLPEGGTIGVAAASSPFENRSEIDRGIRWYEERGYRVKLAPGVHARDDYVAGDAQARADDVTSLFADDEVDVVQMLRGGYGASQVVPHLDYDVIAANPKPFVGYSDVTALHVAIRQRTTVARRRHAHAVAQRREARARQSDRDRRDARLRRVAPAGTVAAQPLDGRRVRAPPRTGR